MSFSKAIFLLNNKCNFNCCHCYVESGNEEINLDKMISFYEDVLKPNNIKKLHFIGGEPFLYGNFKALNAYLSSLKDVEIAFTTNGSILNDDIINSLKKSHPKVIKVSLLSLRQNVYQKIIQENFLLKNTLENIKTLQKYFNIGINMTIIKDNIDDVYPLIDFCLENEIPLLCFSQLTLSGRGIKIKDQRLLSKQIEELVNYIQNLNKPQLHILFDNHVHCNFFQDLVMNWAGDVFPCCALSSYPKFKIGTYQTDMSTLKSNLIAMNKNKIQKCFVDEFVK